MTVEVLSPPAEDPIHLPADAKKEDRLHHGKTDTWRNDAASVSVSEGPGHLCHVECHVHSALPPDGLWALLTNDDNSGIFRDIKAVRNKKILRDGEDGVKLIEIEQLSELKFLWFSTGLFGTLLHVEQDDAERRMTFKLARLGGWMRKFQGEWKVEPEANENAINGEGCHAVLHQDMTPAKIPLWLTKLPILKKVLRGLGMRGTKRVIEDIQNVEKRVLNGEDLHELLTEPTETAKYRNADTQYDKDSGAVPVVRLVVDVDKNKKSKRPVAISFDVVDPEEMPETIPTVHVLLKVNNRKKRVSLSLQ